MQNSDDEDIMRAIALSLQENAQKKPEREIIVISDDEDDSDSDERRFQADLQRAIEASKQHEPPSRPTSSALATSATQSTNATPEPCTKPSATASSSTFLSERAQMERERLARQKRLRPDIVVESPSNAADEEEDGGGHRDKRQRLTPSMRRAHADAPSSVASSSRSATSAQGTIGEGGTPLFWDGALRQTACMHADRAKDIRPTFRLSEILAPRDDIEFAIVSSFQWNAPWLYSLFNPRTPVIAVAQGPQGEENIKAILPNWIKTTPFLRNGMGCMHMKFMLLFYKTGRLRVVITTANMIEYDWRDIENSVWLQDVPRRPSPIAHDPKAQDFATAFIRVLRGVNVAPALISHLQNDHPNLSLQRIEHLRTHWDFSKVRAQLIPSLAGKHEGWAEVILAGHTALMKAVRDLSAAADKGKEVVLECQGSSIGTYSTQWLNEFHCSACGESAQTWLDVSKARRAKLPYPPVKILFPTTQWVRNSVLGEAGGGTMFCRRNQWEGTKFPRELFHESRSKRGRILMHSKMILATYRDGNSAFDQKGKSARLDSETTDEEGCPIDGAEKKPVGWLYVGSHNFTPSAWGTLSGSGFNPTLNITNYELGIVLPLYSQKEAEELACWERPPRKYALGKDEPWIQAESPAFRAGS